MGRKSDIIKLMKLNADKLLARPQKTCEEVMGLGDRMPVACMYEPEQVYLYIEQSGMNLIQGAAFADWVINKGAFIKKIAVNDKITYSELKESYEKVRAHFVDTNRVNYILYATMLDVSDLLERENRLKFAVRKCWMKAESCWNECFAIHRQGIEKTAWFTMQDHMNLYCVSMQPYLEKVYESVRDYMIRQSLRDVELKARCAVVLQMGKVAGMTFRQLFDEYKNRTGADFSKLFARDDLQAMVVWFTKMCNALGIMTHTDEYGFHMLDEIDINSSQRVKWAWDDFMRMLRDVDVANESARRAIELNPKVKEDYENVLAEEAREREEQKQKEMEEGFLALAEKFKVIKKSPSAEKPK